MGATSSTETDLEQQREALIAQLMSVLSPEMQERLHHASAFALQRFEIQLVISHDGTHANIK